MTFVQHVQHNMSLPLCGVPILLFDFHIFQRVEKARIKQNKTYMTENTLRNVY